MKKPKFPKRPHDPKTCVVCQANTKDRTHKGRDRIEGPVGGRGKRVSDREEAWFPDRDIKPAPKPRPGYTHAGYAPLGKHRGSGTSAESDYSGRHRGGSHRAYDARHRR